MTSVQCSASTYRYRIDDRPNDPPTTHLSLWDISNSHISALQPVGHPIHFTFGSSLSRVGFSGSADRTVLLSGGSNPRWRTAAILKNYIHDHNVKILLPQRNSASAAHVEGGLALQPTPTPPPLATRTRMVESETRNKRTSSVPSLKLTLS